MVLGAAGGGIHQLFDLFLNGVILGAIYVLLALGLNVILGLIGVINFAHAAFYMLGAYLTFSFAAHIGFLPAVAAAAVLVGLLGMVMEVSVIRPLYRRIPEHALLLTFGLTLVAEQAVRWHWGDYAKNFDPPSFLAGELSLGGFAYMAASLAYVGALMLLMARPAMHYLLHFGLGVESSRVTALIAIATAVTLSIALTALPLLVAEKRLAALGEGR